MLPWHSISNSHALANWTLCVMKCFVKASFKLLPRRRRCAYRVSSPSSSAQELALSFNWKATMPMIRVPVHPKDRLIFSTSSRNSYGSSWSSSPKKVGGCSFRNSCRVTDSSLGWGGGRGGGTGGAEGAWAGVGAIEGWFTIACLSSKVAVLTCLSSRAIRVTMPSCIVASMVIMAMGSTWGSAWSLQIGPSTILNQLTWNWGPRLFVAPFRSKGHKSKGWEVTSLEPSLSPLLYLRVKLNLWD